MMRVCIVVSFIGLISAKIKTRDNLETQKLNANLNKLVDYYNNQIMQFIILRGLDPLNLPNTEKKLWMRSPNSVDPMLYKADLNLYSGILKYLSVLERYGDATLTYDGRILKMDVGFVFKFLQVTYNYILKMGLFDLNGRILATTKDVRSKISVMFNTTEYTLGLNKLEIQTPGRIKVILKNKNGGTDWINTAIANIIIPFLQSTITSNVQIQATNAIRMYFNEINRIIVPHKVFPGIFENQLLKCT